VFTLRYCRSTHCKSNEWQHEEREDPVGDGEDYWVNDYQPEKPRIRLNPSKSRKKYGAWPPMKAVMVIQAVHTVVALRGVLVKDEDSDDTNEECAT